MVKRVLMLVSGVQESVLIDFVSQNKVKILHKFKTCQNCLFQKFSYKNEQIYIFFNFFEFLSCCLSFMRSFILFLTSKIVVTLMRAVIEKKIAFIVHEIVIANA